MVTATLSAPASEALNPASATDARREPLTARAIMLIVIVLIHIGLLLALLFAKTAVKLLPPVATVVRMIPLPKPEAAPKPKATPKVVTRTDVIKVPIPIVKVPAVKETPAPLFKTEMMEAVDITKLPSHKSETTASVEGNGGTGAGPGTDSGYGAVVGTGPHGEQLYAAAWYREPTQAEIQPYLPKKNLPDVADAYVMCRTIANFGVEDCQELGEDPVGTGLSRAIRQAGWQFKVKPIRHGKTFEVGTWVRIRYTITRLPRSDESGG